MTQYLVLLPSGPIVCVVFGQPVGAETQSFCISDIVSTILCLDVFILVLALLCSWPVLIVMCKVLMSWSITSSEQ